MLRGYDYLSCMEGGALATTCDENDRKHRLNYVALIQHTTIDIQLPNLSHILSQTRPRSKALDPHSE